MLESLYIEMSLPCIYQCICRFLLNHLALAFVLSGTCEISSRCSLSHTVLQALVPDRIIVQEGSQLQTGALMERTIGLVIMKVVVKIDKQHDFDRDSLVFSCLD